jgi:hypothetical protein
MYRSRYIFTSAIVLFSTLFHSARLFGVEHFDANSSLAEGADHLDIDQGRWEFGIHVGVAKPVGKHHVSATGQNSAFLRSDPGSPGEDEFEENGLASPDFSGQSTFQGELRQSYLIGGHLYFKVIPWVALGLDASYSVEHKVSLDAFPASFDSPIYDIRYKVSGGQLTFGGRFGGWIGVFRPWVMGGVGPYLFSQSITAELDEPKLTGGPNDDADHPPVDMGAPSAKIYMSTLVGVGIDLRIQSSGSIGIGLQEQHVFKPGNALEFLIPTARFDYHF